MTDKAFVNELIRILEAIKTGLLDLNDRVTVLEEHGHTKKKNGMTHPELIKLLNDFGVN